MNLSILSLVVLASSTHAFAPSVSGGVTSRASALSAQTGKPAKSKEEDLELTRQIIMDYVSSQAADEAIDDDDDEE